MYLGLFWSKQINGNLNRWCSLQQHRILIINGWHAKSDDIDRLTYHTVFQCKFELLLALNASITLKGYQIFLSEMYIGHQGIMKAAALFKRNFDFGIWSSSQNMLLKCYDTCKPPHHLYKRIPQNVSSPHLP